MDSIRVFSFILMEVFYVNIFILISDHQLEDFIRLKKWKKQRNAVGENKTSFSLPQGGSTLTCNSSTLGDKSVQVKYSNLWNEVI